jgi:hypothetical protein
LQFMVIMTSCHNSGNINMFASDDQEVCPSSLESSGRIVKYGNYLFTVILTSAFSTEMIQVSLQIQAPTS